MPSGEKLRPKRAMSIGRMGTRLSKATKADIERVLKRDRAINIRVSQYDRDRIKQTAIDLKMTVSDYLRGCHEFVSSRLD